VIMTDNTVQKSGSSAKSFFMGMVAAMVLLGAMLLGAGVDRLVGIEWLDTILEQREEALPSDRSQMTNQILREESVVIDVADKAADSVVTVSVTTQRRQAQPLFDPFGFFGQRTPQQIEPETIERDIGTGFVVDGDEGLVVTNRHVVADPDGQYRIITKDDEEYDVTRIYRDPVNDLAILKVDARLPALELGDSDQLQVGQFVIAIGTALGEFRHTVTTGVVSGLGRGITAGDRMSGVVEQIDNVIQTDAAINPGNSGGPLLNSAGQVIGVSVAVAQTGQNVGFAIPINVIKASLDNFFETGQFDRPFLGVSYRMIPRETALMNDVPEGAFVMEVVPGSAAEDAGVEAGDILVRLNGEALREAEGGLAAVINRLRIGDEVVLEVYRDGEMMELRTGLRAVEE
jgi:serine protease Do